MRVKACLYLIAALLSPPFVLSAATLSIAALETDSRSAAAGGNAGTWASGSSGAAANPAALGFTAFPEIQVNWRRAFGELNHASLLAALPIGRMTIGLHTAMIDYGAIPIYQNGVAESEIRPASALARVSLGLPILAQFSIGAGVAFVHEQLTPDHSSFALLGSFSILSQDPAGTFCTTRYSRPIRLALTAQNFGIGTRWGSTRSKPPLDIRGLAGYRFTVNHIVCIETELDGILKSSRGAGAGVSLRVLAPIGVTGLTVSFSGGLSLLQQEFPRPDRACGADVSWRVLHLGYALVRKGEKLWDHVVSASVNLSAGGGW